MLSQTQLDYQEKDDFRSKLISVCEQENGNFIWGTSKYSADLHGNIFHSNSNFDDKLQQIAQNTKCTFLPKNAVVYYDFGAQPTPSYESVKYYTSHELKLKLSQKSIYKIKNRPKISYLYDRAQLKNEVLSCFSFVSYILIMTFINKKALDFIKLQDIIHPVIVKYFSKRFENLPTIDYKSTDLKKGDLIFFHEKSADDNLKCRHVGFFYGFNENNLPLIYDLWIRDGSNAAKVISYTLCAIYDIRRFKITVLSLDKLYLELKQKINVNDEAYYKIKPEQIQKEEKLILHKQLNHSLLFHKNNDRLLFVNKEINEQTALIEESESLEGGSCCTIF